jgi:uncharacterized protein YbjT (DUF2867 family)
MICPSRVPPGAEPLSISRTSVNWRARWLILLVALGSGCSQEADPKGGVLVFGGTGQLGAEIVERLVAGGEKVTVFVRPTSDRARLAGMVVEYSVGDMLNEADVASAFQGHSYRAVINAVRAPITDAPFYDLTSQYVVAHVAAERNFMASGISTVVIRNSRVWPDGTQSTGQASLSEDHSMMTPITREDLADFTLECLDNPARAGKVYHAVDSTLTWPPPGRE